MTGTLAQLCLERAARARGDEPQPGEPDHMACAPRDG